MNIYKCRTKRIRKFEFHLNNNIVRFLVHTIAMRNTRRIYIWHHYPRAESKWYYQFSVTIVTQWRNNRNNVYSTYYVTQPIHIIVTTENNLIGPAERDMRACTIIIINHRYEIRVLAQLPRRYSITRLSIGTPSHWYDYNIIIIDLGFRKYVGTGIADLPISGDLFFPRERLMTATTLLQNAESSTRIENGKVTNQFNCNDIIYYTFMYYTSISARNDLWDGSEQ